MRAEDGRARQGGLPRRAARATWPACPGTNIVIGQPISHRIDHMLSGTPRQHRRQDLRRRPRRAAPARRSASKAVVQDVPGVVDVSTEQQTDIPFLTVALQPRRAGPPRPVASARSAEAIETAFVRHGGRPGAGGPGDLRPGRALSTRPRTADLDAVRATLITTASGARLPLLGPGRHPQGPRRRTSSAARTCSARSWSWPTSPAATWAAWWTTSAAQVGERGASCRRATTSSTAASSRAPRRPSRTLLVPGPGRDRRHLPAAVRRLPLGPRRAAGHAQPAAGAHRRRGRRLRLRRRAVGGLDHRLHHPVRHRHPQRHHDDLPHPAPGRARGRDRSAGGGAARRRWSGWRRS